MRTKRNIVASARSGKPRSSTLGIVFLAVVAAIAMAVWALRPQSSDKASASGEAATGDTPSPVAVSGKPKSPSAKKPSSAGKREASKKKKGAQRKSGGGADTQNGYIGSDDVSEGSGAIGEDCPEWLESDEGQKLAALSALEALYAQAEGEDGSSEQTPREIPNALRPFWRDSTEGDAGDGEPAEGQEDGIDPEGDEFRNTVNLLTMALEDPSSSVRDAAFEAMVNLPDAQRSVLSLQVIGGDDDLLKNKLIENAGNATDEFSVTLLMQALDDGNENLKSKASERLGELFSKTFSSTEEALTWWEENSGNYTFTDGGIAPASADNDAPDPPEGGGDGDAGAGAMSLGE